MKIQARKTTTLGFKLKHRKDCLKDFSWKRSEEFLDNLKCLNDDILLFKS